ncbi:MAG: type II toxin-antitoxin system RelE/ParE family toxin [Chthoniobacter sp.]
MLFLAQIDRGLRCNVYALGALNEEVRVNLPYADLRALLGRKCSRDLAQLDRLLGVTKDLGPPFALGKAARVTDTGLYEIRTRRGTRLFWIYGPDRAVILLNGYQKQKWAIPRHELARACSWADALARQDLSALLAAARPMGSAIASAARDPRHTSAVRKCSPQSKSNNLIKT